MGHAESHCCATADELRGAGGARQDVALDVASGAGRARGQGPRARGRRGADDPDRGQLAVSPDRIRRWRRRFERERVAGVGTTAPGRGRKPSLAEGTVAEIVRMTLHERPADGATHWTTRTLAAEFGVSRETVRRVWTDHGLR